MSAERDERKRLLANWLAVAINILQEQYRRPNYDDMLVQMNKIQEQLPKVKQTIIFLKNTNSTEVKL